MLAYFRQPLIIIKSLCKIGDRNQRIFTMQVPPAKEAVNNEEEEMPNAKMKKCQRKVKEMPKWLKVFILICCIFMIVVFALHYTRAFWMTWILKMMKSGKEAEARAEAEAEA